MHDATGVPQGEERGEQSMAAAHVGHGPTCGYTGGNGLERRGEGPGMHVEALGRGEVGEQRESWREGSIHET
ncbi:hypothetical protein [Archangium violaceum]|uniref:hypothetical protein n=1 Tax=Archangium violaceum TaxID=83451 RepID=UPI003D26E748